MSALLAVFFAFGLAVFVLGLQGLAYFPLTIAYEVWKRRALKRIAAFEGLVSVIVPAYNEERTLRETVLTLLESDWPALEIVVVDDGSTDATAARVQDIADAGRIRLLRQQNAGKAAALNAGIAIATGEVILFTDADSLFFPDTVRKMARWFGDARIDAVCGNDAPLHPGAALQKLLVLTTHLGTGFVRRSLSMLRCLPIISGNLGAIRKRVFDEIGGFARTWGEDLEITFRLQQHRKRIVFDPEAKVLAECPGTLAALWRQRVRWMRSYLKVCRQYRALFFGARPFSLYLPVNFAAMAVVPVLQAALLALLPFALAQRRLHLQGPLALLSLLGLGFFFTAAVYSALLDKAPRDLRWLPYGLLILPLSYFFDAVALRSWWGELRGDEERWHKTERRPALRRAPAWALALGLAAISSALTFLAVDRNRPQPLLPFIAAPAKPAFQLGLSTHFDAWPEWRDALRTVQARPMIGKAALIGVGAGRTEWTYFRWQGHEAQWSNHQRGEPKDDLLREAAREFRGQKIAALVDLFAPKYVKDHPDAAAVDRKGKPSDSQIGLAELAEGAYGDKAIEMIESLAANYPIDAVDLTELPYYETSFSAKDRQSFGREWPRDANGDVDIEDPAVWDWKSAELEKFVARAAQAVRRHGKELYVDVSASWKDFRRNGREFGHDYERMLRHADAIVVWNYFALEGKPAAASGDLARYLSSNFPRSHVWVSLGLWGDVAPDELDEALAATLQGGIRNVWITPNDLATASHWTGIVHRLAAPEISVAR